MRLADRCARLPLLARRLLALIVVPLAMALALGAISLPVLGARHSQDEWREDARKLLARAKTADSTRASLDAQIAAMRASQLWSKFYPASAAGVPSGTALQSDIRALLGSLHVSAQTLTPIAAQELPLFIRTGARVTASMRVDQLRELTAALASHPRHLRIERLMVDAPREQLATENPPLAVTAEIYGYQLRSSAVKQ